MNVARHLVWGADVWLNTPIKDNEASGTSGMKAAMYAVLSSGVLHAEAKFGVSPSQMLQILNDDLKARAQQRMNCAMCIATIDLNHRLL